MRKENSIHYVMNAEKFFGTRSCNESGQTPNATFQMLDDQSEQPVDQSAKLELHSSMLVAEQPLTNFSLESKGRVRPLQSQSSVCSSVDMDCNYCALQDQLQQQFALQMLKRHNQLRSKHGVPSLTLNQNVSLFSLKMAFDRTIYL